jgi:hypothetical protein
MKTNLLSSRTTAPCLADTAQVATSSGTQRAAFAAPMGMPSAQKTRWPSATTNHRQTTPPRLAKPVQTPAMVARGEDRGGQLPSKLILGDNLEITPQDLLTKNMDQLRAMPGVKPEHVPLIEMAMVHYGNMLHRLQGRDLLSLLEELKFTTEDGAHALADAAETRAHLDMWLADNAAPAMDQARNLGGALWLTPQQLHTHTLPELMQTPGFVAKRHSSSLQMAVAKFGGMPNRLIHQSIPEVIEAVGFTDNAAVRALCEVALIHQSKLDFVQRTTGFDTPPTAKRPEHPRNTSTALDLQLAIKSGKTLAQIATDPALDWNSARDLMAVHEAIKDHEKRTRDEPNAGLN